MGNILKIVPESEVLENMTRAEYANWRREQLESLRPLTAVVLEVEREYIEFALDLCDGNIVEAAIRLGIGRNTLYRKRGKPGEIANAQ